MYKFFLIIQMHLLFPHHHLHMHGKSVLKEETIDEPTGSEALLALNADPAEAKRKAVALEDDTCLEAVNEESFLGYFREHPQQVLHIMQQLSGNLRRRTNEYVEVCRKIQELAEKEELK